MSSAPLLVTDSEAQQQAAASIGASTRLLAAEGEAAKFRSSQTRQLEALPLSRMSCVARRFFFPVLEARMEALLLQQNHKRRRGASTSKKRSASGSSTLVKLDWFEALVAVAIVSYFVTLSIVSGTSGQNAFIVFLTFFFLGELIVRMIAMGPRYLLCFAAFRALDSLLILVGFAGTIIYWSNISGSSNLSTTRSWCCALSLLRILRVFKLLQRVKELPSISIIVSAIKALAVSMADATLLLALCLIVFAGAALAPLAPRMSQRCVNNIALNSTCTRELWSAKFAILSVVGLDNSTIPDLSDIATYVCGGWFDSVAFPVLVGAASSSSSNSSSAFGDFTPLLTLFGANNISVTTLGCNSNQLCSTSIMYGFQCPFGYTCLADVQAPYGGYVQFDNMVWSFMNMFISISMQIWYEIGYYATASIGPSGFAFMSAFTLLVSYFVLNVIIIILCIEFDKARRKEEHRLALETAAGLRDQSSISIFQAAKGTGRRFQRLVNLLVQQKAKEAEELKQQQELQEAERGERIEEEGGDSMEGSSSSMAAGRQPHRRSSIVAAAALVLPPPALMASFRELSTAVCQSLAFRALVSLNILVNTIFICLVHEGMSASTAALVQTVSLVCTVVFVVETLIRIISVGPGAFVRSPSKMMDSVIIILSIVDSARPGLHIGWLRVLRLLRVLGFILSAFPKVLFWFAFSQKAVMRAPLVAVSLWLLVLTFGAMGLQLYAGTLCGVDTSNLADNNNPSCLGRPMNNFDSFTASQITSFQILTADNWNAVLYNVMQANGNIHGLLFCIYYFLATVVGLSLFTASMLSARDEEQTDVVEIGSVEAKLIELAQQAKRHATTSSAGGLDDSSTVIEQPPDAVVQQAEHSPATGEDALVIALGEPAGGRETTTVGTLSNMVGTGVDVAVHSYSRLRQIIRTVVDTFWYRLFSAGVVVVQSLSLALVDPLKPPDEYSTFALNVVNVVSTFFFMGETGLRIVAYGFIRGEDSFIRRSKWNVFDFFMLLLSILGIVLTYGSSSSSRSAFAVRSALSLRPLLIVKLFPQVELVLFSMARSIADLRYLIGTIGIFYLTAAIAGVHMFSGALYSCQSPAVVPASMNMTSYWLLDAAECAAMGGQWLTSDPNFDNIFEAFFSVFFISIMENWSSFMFELMDYSGVNKAPVTNANKYASIYCIVVVLVTGFIIPNLVSTSLVRSYNKVKRSATHQKSAFETSEKNAWLQTNKRLVRMLPVAVRQIAIEGDQPTSMSGNVQQHLGRAVGAAMSLVGIDHERNVAVKSWTNFVRGENFKLCCFFLSFASFVCAAVQFYPGSTSLATFLRNSDIFFSVCFCGEMLVKVWCEGASAYLASTWNRADALITISSTIFVGIEPWLGISFARGIRCFRLLRVNRVVQSASQLQVLMTSIGFSITQIIPVLAICFIIYSAFSTAAIFLFGRLTFSPYDPNTICYSVNFASFGSAFGMLFRLSTGGNWYSIVQVASNTSPTCDDEMQRLGLCGPPLWLARAYFSVWMIISYYILNNIVIATLLDAFLCSANERALSKKDSKKIMAVWESVDPQLTMSVKPFDVLSVLRRMPARSSMACMAGGAVSRCSQELRFLTALGIEDPSNPKIKVSFRAFYDLLCRTAFDVSVPPRDRVLQFDFENEHLAVALRLLEAKSPTATQGQPNQHEDRLQQLLGSPIATAGASALKAMMKLTTSSASFLLGALLPEELMNQASAAADDIVGGAPALPDDVKESLVEATGLFRRSAALMVINEFVKKWRARRRAAQEENSSGRPGGEGLLGSKVKQDTLPAAANRRFLPFSFSLGPLLERLSDGLDDYSSDEEMSPVLNHPL